MWSRSILVTALTSGRTTLVLSSRPPSPTSTTAISAPRAAKSAKAMAVLASKKVAFRSRIERPEPLGPHRHRVLGDGNPVHPDALAERDEMG